VSGFNGSSEVFVYASLQQTAILDEQLLQHRKFSRIFSVAQSDGKWLPLTWSDLLSGIWAVYYKLTCFRSVSTPTGAPIGPTRAPLADGRRLRQSAFREAAAATRSLAWSSSGCRELLNKCQCAVVSWNCWAGFERKRVNKASVKHC